MTKTLAALLLAVPALAFAQATPAGLWKTIDDATKKEKSLVRIVESNGVFTGKVEKIVDPDAATTTCKDCSDDRKDQPIVGMTIVRNVKQNADDRAVYDGGDILDPASGKVYKVRLKPIDGGQKLEVRGFIGISLLGRTQTWIRAE